MMRADQIERICDVSLIIPSTTLRLAVRPTSDVIDSTNHRFGCIVPAWSARSRRRPRRHRAAALSSSAARCGASLNVPGDHSAGASRSGAARRRAVPRLTSCHAANPYPANFLYDLAMIVPPLNQTLWMLLVASLTALAGWGALQLLATTDRKKPDPKSVSKRRSDVPSGSRPRSDS